MTKTITGTPEATPTAVANVDDDGRSVGGWMDFMTTPALLLG